MCVKWKILQYYMFPVSRAIYIIKCGMLWHSDFLYLLGIVTKLLTKNISVFQQELLSSKFQAKMPNVLRTKPFLDGCFFCFNPSVSKERRS